MSNNMSAFDEFDDEYDDDDVTETRRAEKKDKKVEGFRNADFDYAEFLTVQFIISKRSATITKRKAAICSLTI